MKRLAFFLWSLGAFIGSGFGAIGFQQLTVPDPEGQTISVAVWYPSDGAAVLLPLGPFHQLVCRDGHLSVLYTRK